MSINVDNYTYQESDDELDDTQYNEEWKNNKTEILRICTDKDIPIELSNYGNNVILFYKKKIEAVNKLMKLKQSDNKKNFIGDVTIQDEQLNNIGKLIRGDSSTKKIGQDELNGMIDKYYSQIGNESKEVMKRDYDERNKTIKYICPDLSGHFF